MKDLERLEKCIRAIHDGIENNIDYQKRNDYFKLVFHEGLSIALSYRLQDPYDRIIKLLKKKAPHKGKLLSEAQIDNILMVYLIDLHYKSKRHDVISNIGREAGKLIRIIKNLSSHKYLIIIPLIKLRIEVSLKIGFVQLTELNSKNLKDLSLQSGVRSNTQSLDEEQKIIQEMKASLPYLTVSIVSVEANDEKEAEKIAIQMTDQALNIIRFYMKPSPYSDFMIKGEELEEITRTVISYDLTSKIEHICHEICNMKDPEINQNNVIDEIMVHKMRNQNLDYLSNLLTKPEYSLTNLQGDILTSIYWLGNGFKDRDSTDKFIKYMIAFDTLLVKGRRDKSEEAAKRYASIINRNETDFSVIGHSYCQLKGWYSVRNRVMHAGLKYVSSTMVDEVRMAVCRLVYELVEHSKEYSSIEKIDELFPIHTGLLQKINCDTDYVLEYTLTYH